ncbi:MAG: FAD-dependent oxidoreductase [Pseudomonadota bacterium]
MPSPEVIVVGAGIAGLGAAGLLQSRGISTLVLEKSGSPGGRSKTRVLPGGWRVDSGTHCVDLGDQSPYADLLARVGAEVSWSRPITGIKVFDQGRWVTDAEYLGIVNDRDNGLARLDEEIGRMSDEDLAALDAVSLETLIERLDVPDRLAEYMKMLGMVYTTLTDPEKISAGEFAYLYREGSRRRGPGSALSAVRMPLGGISTAIEAQAEAFLAKGGILEPGRKVLKVEKPPRGGWAVITEGEVYRAPTVVLAVPLWHLVKILDLNDPAGPWPLAWKSRISELTQETSASMGFTMGVNMIMLEEPVYLSCWRLPGLDLPLQCLVHSVFDDTTAPPGHSLAFIGAVCTPRQALDAEFRRRTLAGFWDLTQKMFPGVEEKVVWKQDGFYVGVDGLARAPYMTGTHRPPVFLADVPGVYFAGDCYTGRGVGMNAAANSAMLCAEKILTDLEKI